MDRTLSSTFRLDRFRWNIGYKGSWADKTLVDKDITFSIVLHLSSPGPDRIDFDNKIIQSIQHKIDLGLMATQQKDIDLYMSLIPEDAQVIGEDGKVISRKEQRDLALRDWSIIDTTLSINMIIDSVQILQSDRILVYTSQKWKRLMYQRDGITLDTILTTQKHKELWKLTRNGWFGYDVTELGGEVFINGELYAPIDQ